MSAQVVYVDEEEDYASVILGVALVFGGLFLARYFMLTTRGEVTTKKEKAKLEVDVYGAEIR